MKGARARPLAVAASALLAAGLAAPVAGASHGTYTVVQCDPLNRGNADAILEDASPYAARSFCGDPHNGHAIKIDNTGHAQHGGFGRVRWATGSADLSIVAVDVRAKLRRDNGHGARLWMGDAKLNQVAGIASGGDGATAFKRYRWSASGRGSSQFVAGLSCERPAGCRRSNAAKTWVRDVHLEVADYSDPVFAIHWTGRSWQRAGFEVLSSCGLTPMIWAAVSTESCSGSTEVLPSLQRGSCDAIPAAKSSPRLITPVPARRS